MSARFNPILFDLDGTLVDSGADIARAVNVTFAELGLPALEEGEITRQVGDGVRKLVVRCLDLAGAGLDVDETIQRFRRHYRRHAVDLTRPYPGVVELLGRLPAEHLAVVTNKPGDFARQVLEGLDLLRFFSVVIGGDETERPKPDPQPLREACRRLGTKPTGGIMIGDYENDVAAGRAAGMSTCGVLWGFAGNESVRRAGPDHLCADVAALQELLLAGN